MSSNVVGIIYRNWKGVASWRTITPVEYVKKESSWHGEGEHHILVAFDHEKQASRDFLLKDIVKFDTAHMSLEDINDIVEGLNNL